MSISFESYFGISPVRERQVTTYPVNVQAVLGFDPYKEVASLSIKLPPLPTIPPHMKSWSGITHLLELWQQAAKWTSMPDDKRKKAEWVWRNSLKREATQQALLGCVEQLHVLREENSQLCPLLWAWWRITKLLEEGKSGMEFLSVWSSSALKSPKMRRWFYQEVDQENILRRQVWPDGASSLLSLIRQFEDEARKLPDASSHRRLWEEVYSRVYNDTIERARFVQAAAQRRIKERAEKYDLGVWLSTNLVEYLGLTQTSTSVVQNSLQAKTKLRKNSKSR